MKLELLPAVDVKGGQAVRLVQGELGSESNYGSPLEARSPVHAAKRLGALSRLRQARAGCVS